MRFLHSLLIQWLDEDKNYPKSCYLPENQFFPLTNSDETALRSLLVEFRNRSRHFDAV